MRLLSIVFVLFAIAGLGLIIFVHELGHFTAGKLLGLTVREFKFGLPGPELIGFDRGDTRYGVTAIPFGGYVKFAGLESELSLGDEESEDVPDRRNFDKQSIPRKSLIIAAGPVMNFVFAAVIFSSILMIQGTPVGAKPQVDAVEPKTPAAAAGLKAGDTINEVDGKHVKSWEDVQGEIRKRPGQRINMTIDRGGKSMVLSPVLKNKSGKGFLGITPVVVYRRENPIAAIGKGIVMTVSVTFALIKALALIIATKAGALVSQSRGPVGIVQETAAIAKQNIWYFIDVLALLSINIGVVNLIPFPPLDGGRIALYGVEGISGRRLNRKLVMAISLVGVAILLTFILYVTVADILRILASTGGF